MHPGALHRLPTGVQLPRTACDSAPVPGHACAYLSLKSVCLVTLPKAFVWAGRRFVPGTLPFGPWAVSWQLPSAF